LIGSTLAVAAFSATGHKVGLPEGLRDIAFAVIGVSLGSSVNERLFDHIGTWSISLAILVVSLVATILVGRWVLMRWFGLDGQTATLGSAPGTMSNAVAIAAEGRGDATAVMFLQLMRLMVLVVAVPPLAVALDSSGGGKSMSVHSMDAGALIGLLALALLLGFVGSRLGLPAAALLSGMLLSATGHAEGLVHGVAPSWLRFAAFAVTGAVLGSRMSRVTRAQFGRYAFAGATAIGSALLVSLAFAWLTQLLTNLPFGQIWIAYAPGGVEAMSAIGLSLGYDPAYVAVHHFARIFSLILIVPITLKL
jgi:membrane AbrB-like protein